MLAHAGVLAATSSLMEKELSSCERGSYHITLPLNSEEMDLFIDFAYTGEKSHVCSWRNVNKFCDDIFPNRVLHATNIMSKLHEFGDRGLFCNMACHIVDGGIQPCHSYLMAAQCDFLSENIKSGTVINLKFSSNDFKPPPPLLVLGVSPVSSNDVKPPPPLTFFGASKVSSNNVKHPPPLPFLGASPVSSHDIKHPPPLPFLGASSVNVGPIHKPYDTHVLNQDINQPTRYRIVRPGPNKTNSEQRPVYMPAVRQSARKKPYPFNPKKPYRCQHCHRTFVSEAKVKDHELRHLPENRHACDICSESYATVRALQLHKRLHPGDRIYNCPICYTKLIQRCQMRQHLMTHFKNKPAHRGHVPIVHTAQTKEESQRFAREANKSRHNSY